MKLLLSIFTILVSAFNYMQANNPKVDSLLNLVRSDKADTNKVNHLNLLSSYYGFANADSAVLFGEQALKLAGELKFIKGTVKAYNNQGRAYALQGNFKDALIRFNKALEFNVRSKDSTGIIEAYQHIGSAYRAQGKYPEALENYLFALKIAEKCRPRELAECYNMIGIVYDYQGNFEESLKNHRLSLKHAPAGKKTAFINSYNNIGMIYYGIGRLDSALSNYNKALIMANELGGARLIAGIYLNIGGVLQAQKKYDDALKNYFAFLEVSKGMGDSDGIAICYLNIGGVYIGMKNAGKAKNYLGKALTISKQTGNKLVTRTAYEGMAKADSLLGDYKSAFEHYKNYIQYRDSLINEENTRKTVQQQMQYEFDKKEATTKADQLKKDAIATEEKRKQEIILWSVASGLALVLIFAAFVYRAFTQKKKANIKISTQKNIIEEKQKEILDSIYYARRIQRSLLPTELYIEKNLSRIRK